MDNVLERGAELILSPAQLCFIADHASDDLSRLLLSASRYPDQDVPFLVDQIHARRQIQGKLPTWAALSEIVFPAKITAEQCSSEQTASYKQRLLKSGQTVCDLTGGLGVDSYFFSRQAAQLTYVERYPRYCAAARHNFPLLRADNIKVVQADCIQYVEQMQPVDLCYIDPARRDKGNKRLFALQDCEPDLLALLPRLWEKTGRVVAKLSPMADLQMTLSLLPQTTEVHVLAVRNECKELLFVLQREKEATDADPVVHCVNWSSEGIESHFVYNLQDEASCPPPSFSAAKRYLYEPNVAILKAGAFKQVALRMEVEKLHVNSHLYTSERLVENFPGRIFQIEETLPFSGKLCKSLSKQIPQANITVRNFPLSVEELRKRTHIADGGDVYLFATTQGKDEKILLKCKKV